MRTDSILWASLLAGAALTGTASADAPQVTADIAPVHSLVAAVMGDTGTPSLIVAPGASPHGYALRPSEARALSQSKVIFWTGEGLLPWFGETAATLGPDAVVIDLSKVDGLHVLPSRDIAIFEGGGHDHGHGHDGHDDHATHGHKEEHDDDHAVHKHDAKHDDHDHAEHKHEAKHGDHDHAEHAKHGHGDHDNHAHGPNDPHLWLAPENAVLWAGVIADALAKADPDHAATYKANAETLVAEIEALTETTKARLAPVLSGKYIVLHDAYQYFEHEFDLPAAAAISLSDATDPGAARLRELQAFLAENKVTCAFTEPQINSGALKVAIEGLDLKLGELDPLGSALEPGPDLYKGLITGLADSLAGCLGPAS